MDLDVLFKESILSDGYPINENGDTYGPNIGNEMLGEPDLISAVGKDGNKGYVYTKELGGKQPDNPEEAVAITKENERKGSWTIPLYEKDGETQIGEFEIGN